MLIPQHWLRPSNIQVSGQSSLLGTLQSGRLLPGHKHADIQTLRRKSLRSVEAGLRRHMSAKLAKQIVQEIAASFLLSRDVAGKLWILECSSVQRKAKTMVDSSPKENTQINPEDAVARDT